MERDVLERQASLGSAEDMLAASSRSPYVRTAFLICLHVSALLAEYCAMIILASHSWIGATITILLLQLICGTFCAYTAWHSTPQSNHKMMLPLREHGWHGLLLCIPYGYFQGVVICLAVDRCLQEVLERTTDVSTDANENEGQMQNRYNAKAMVAVVETIPVFSILLFFMWNVGFPSKKVVSGCAMSTFPHAESGAVDYLDPWEEACILAAAILCMFSAGLGLLELDCCVSRRVAERVEESNIAWIIHILFRTSEMYMRSALICIVIIMYKSHTLAQGSYSYPYILTMILEFSMAFWAIHVFGGRDAGWNGALVRFLCAFVVVWSNVFMFIDSPYKQRAARKLSRWLTFRNAMEPLVCTGFLAIVYHFLPFNQRGIECLTGLACQLYHRHPKSTSTTVAFGGVYLATFVYMTWWNHWWDPRPDIFTACERGDLEVVRQLLSRGVETVNPNASDVKHRTPLILASRPCSHKHVAVVRELLAAGAVVRLKRIGGWTALHYAVRYGNFEAVHLLVSQARLDSRQPWDPQAFVDDKGRTPLHLALALRREDIVKFLWRHCSEWAAMANCRAERPADPDSYHHLRSSDIEMLRTMSASASEPLVGSESFPSLEPALHPNSDGRIVLRIGRSCVEEEHLEATGLCSFVAGSSSGVLNRVFLTQLGRRFGPLATIHEREETTQSEEEIHHTGNSLQAIVLTMEDLEPVDENGNPDQVWVVRRAQGQELSGKAYARQIPFSARIGEGGQGLVWRAKHRLTGCFYAVKNRQVRRDNDIVALRECEAAEHVQVRPHPCIVELFHVHHFREACLYSLVLEYCPGGNLLNHVQEARPVTQQARCESYQPPALAVDWIAQVFLALEHLHLSMDTLIRDLKPENVVLKNNVAKITDFGLFRVGAQSTGVWSFGTPPGTPGYFAPEVVRGDPYNWKADMYSFGVMIWVVMTGGLAHEDNPRPPSGKRRHSHDFKALCQDWQLLEFAVKTESSRGVFPPICEPGKSLVLRLVAHSPSLRLDHRQLREQPFFQLVGLPPEKASAVEVREWLRRRLSSAGP